MATGAGYERRENETYSWEGSKRGAFVVIQHTIAGRGELDFAGTRHALLPGDTMLLTFPHANRYWLEPGQRWEYFWIGIHGREGLRIAARRDRRAPGRWCTRRARALWTGWPMPAWRWRRASCRSATRRRARLRGDHGDARCGVRRQPRPPMSSSPLPVRRVEAYIEQHLAANLSIDRLARVAGISRAHFVRLFSAHVGLAPSAYVWKRRIELAERLLLATDGTVEAIAKACGFADGNYFAKAFRRANELTPTEFRSARRRRAH